jgi:hypothetical protein
MTQSTPTADDFATFPALSLSWAALWSKASPGFTFHLDDDATHELFTVVRPRRRDGMASFAIVPTTEGVLMSTEDNDWRHEAAFASLRAALLTIHDPSPERLAGADRKAASAAVWNPTG